MRGKVAKALRRAAERATVGEADVAYQQTRAGTRVLVPGTTRHQYLELKRDLKAERRG